MITLLRMRVHLLLVCVVAVLPSLVGCSSMSTGASMQVEVEVYKGPLSKEPQAQLGELCGTVDELKRNLKDYHRTLFASMLELPKDPFKTLDNVYRAASACNPSDTQADVTDDPANRKPMAKCWCDDVKVQRTYSEKAACIAISQLHDEVEELRDEVRWFEKEDELAYQHTCGDAAGTAKRDPDNDNRIKISRAAVTSPKGADMNQQLQARALASGANPGASPGGPSSELDLADEFRRRNITRLSRLAMHLKLKAMYRAEADSVFLTQDRLVRSLTTSFSNLTAEYSNQIGSRADAWLKQTDVAQATSLPQSVYLRDSQPTEFVNLYVWNRAAAPPLAYDVMFHPVKSMSSEGTADRVRGIERLFSDSYWSKINTVYASGQGDISMALVKDDIGNWNLKSFSADPSKLLKAYKDGGLALIQKAAELGKTATGVPDAGKVLGFANALALGQSNGSGADETRRLAEKLHSVTQQRLEKLRKSLDEEGAESEQVLTAAKRVLSDHEANLDALVEVGAKASAGVNGTPTGGGIKDSAEAGIKDAAKKAPAMPGVGALIDR